MTSPIRAFVGHNGGGKTLAMIDNLVLRAWAEGRQVYANLRLYPERLGYPEDLAQPLGSWRDLENLRGCVLLFDEISSVLPSRQFGSVPAQMMRKLNQLRKVDVEIGWTAPNWARCDVLLREVTQAVTVCSGSFPDHYVRVPASAMPPRHPFGVKLADDQGKAVKVSRRWPPQRLFTWTTYDAKEFDEFTLAAVAKVKPQSVQRHWRPWNLAQYAYDTLETVDLLDHLDDVGVCVVCNGTRRRAQCKCDDTKPKPPAGPVDPGVLALAGRGRR